MPSPKIQESKPVTFRLYPEPNSTLFCRVNVWRNKQEMVEHFRREHGKRPAGWFAGTAAMATGHEVYRVRPGGRMRKTGEFCVINCQRDRLDVEIVSHEVTHAAWRWRSRVGLSVEGDIAAAADAADVPGSEERFCYALGRMVQWFVHNLQRKRIWKTAVA